MAIQQPLWSLNGGDGGGQGLQDGAVLLTDRGKMIHLVVQVVCFTRKLLRGTCRTTLVLISYRFEGKGEKNKTKQNKTKQNKTKQNKTKQNKTKQNKTKQTKQNKTKQNKEKKRKEKKRKEKKEEKKEKEKEKGKDKELPIVSIRSSLSLTASRFSTSVPSGSCIICVSLFEEKRVRGGRESEGRVRTEVRDAKRGDY